MALPQAFRDAERKSMAAPIVQKSKAVTKQKNKIKEMQKAARKKREAAKAAAAAAAETATAFTPAIDAFKKVVGGIGDFASGIKDDVSMGFNPESRDQDYYRRTMDTINRTRGLEAAQDYYDRMSNSDDANVRGFFGGTGSIYRMSAPSEQLAPRIGGQPGGSISGGGFVPPDAGDGTGPVDAGDGTGPVDGDGNPIAPGIPPGEEEIEYTYMPPFFGGYQPATRADTLVPSQGRGIGSFLPNPRLDPIFPQQPPPDFEVRPMLPGYDYKHNGNFDFGAPANLGDTHYNPDLDTTYTYQEKPNGQGGFYSGWDITQGNGGEMMLYGGGASQGLMNDLSAQGVGNLFGNEQAPPSMYQGIMG